MNSIVMFIINTIHKIINVLIYQMDVAKASEFLQKHFMLKPNWKQTILNRFTDC